MRKIGYISKYIKLGVYPIKIELVIATTDISEANKYFKKKYCPANEVYVELCERSGICRMQNSQVGILIYKNSSPEVAIHECTHAICFALSYMGINYGDVENNEVLAYPLGYLCREVFNELHEWRDKK